MATDYKNDDEQRKIDVNINPLERKNTRIKIWYIFWYSLLLRREIHQLVAVNVNVNE